MNIELDELPHGRRVFDELRGGTHIDEREPKLYRALTNHFDEFRALFDYLGFELEYHDRGFFYFQGDGSSQLGKRAQQISVFFFVFVDALGSRGADVIDVLFQREGHRIGHLPHFERAQHRECLAGVGVESQEDLRRLVKTMERYNFVDRLDGSVFRICRPAWRFIELCYEYADGTDSGDGEE